jgi:predicted alpha/beta-hydrolase family hydrolase
VTASPAIEREVFEDDTPGAPAVRGVLHRAVAPSGDALVLTHGAGSNREAPLLVALADALAARGVGVLRCDLPFRQARATGPPSPRDGAADRAGLRHAVTAVAARVPGRIALGGHSYGGRQASMLAAEQAGLVTALLLLSYPLHPPSRPTQLRTAHFPSLHTPTMFVQGSKDLFGSRDDLRAAITTIAAPTTILELDGAGHALRLSAAGEIAEAFLRWWRPTGRRAG